MAYGDYWTSARVVNKIIPLPDSKGQYVILYPTAFYGNPGVAEVWIWGDQNFWKIEGDATLDCKVNILDLIFIRNRLNQDPETGDNWQANVNQDDKINILDLIYVRNRLNTKCEE